MPVPSTVIALGALGGGAYLLTRESDPGPRGSPNILRRGGEAKGQRVTEGGARSSRMNILSQRGFGAHPGTAGVKHPYIDGGSAAETAARQALQHVEGVVKKEYDELSEKARKAGADYINDELGTDLTGEESFEDAAAVIGAAAGGALAAAGCTAVGLGAVAYGCKLLGAMAGAYLGKKIGEYLGDAWDDVKDWASDQWEDAGEAVEDAWDEVGDFLGGLW